ncbi:hypothetical protein PCASD_08833 [Puccinia coronata f. sp. avenae]|uniref:Uncharacterized protein n=1 Tax=Puccinia coronata f. sp. avenae TaxID=200324 RepID=A0A2N5URW3_9BASI|nr:hypothetical protein PCASD_08833 [Puccinia coronata f. sp. avenae]
MYTELGVKDILNKSIVDWKYEILSKKDAATSPEREFLEQFTNVSIKDTPSMFNPFFQLDSFDGCLDTPVEALHFFLLGIVKYLVCDFMKQLAPADIPEVVARYQLFDTGSLNIPSLQPHYLTRHYANFIGKDFKVVLQSAPFVLFAFMTDSKQCLWSALCQLAPLVFQTHIDNMNTYQDDLKLYICNFMYHLIKSMAQWVNKPKFYSLGHLPQSTYRFGSASLFATNAGPLR